MKRWWVWVAAAVAALGIGVGARYLVAPAEMSAERGAVTIGGPFRLVDQDGQMRTDADFRGKYTLVYFGYTYCPDVCPTALQVMTVALDALGEAGRDVIPVFVTVDPERDTVDVMADYVTNFHDRLVALTGDAEAIREAARGYRVYYKKAGEGEADYLVDHTSIVYLMDREGRYLAHFTHTTDPQAMAAKIREFL